MSEDFGSYLKHERELRGVPLDEIAESTKISIRFLRALEENRFEDLPGEVFIKGFIRSYGQAIGSNVDELMAVYHESSGGRQEEPAPSDAETPPPISVPEENPAPKSAFPMKAVLGFVMALLIIGGGGYWITLKKSETPEETRVTPPPPTVDNTLPESAGEEDPAVSEAVNDPVPSAEAPVSEPDPPEAVVPPKPPVSTSPETAPAADPGPSEPVKNTFTVPEKTDTIKDIQDQAVAESTDPATEPASEELALNLVITVDENSWFNLRVDEQRDQDFILPPGGSKTIQAKSAIVMTIGNRRATQMTLNGQPLEIPESPDNVIRNFNVNAELLN